MRMQTKQAGIHRLLSVLHGNGFRFLFILDAVGLFTSMVLINVVRFGFHWPTYRLTHYGFGFATATCIHLFVNYLSGLYEREPQLGRRPWLPTIVLATSIGVGMDSAAFVLLNRYLMPRLNLAALIVVGSAVLAGNRSLSRRLTIRRLGAARIALVGSADAIDAAQRHLFQAAEDSPSRSSLVVCTTTDTSRLRDLVAEHRVTDVLLLDVHAFGTIFPEPLVALEHANVSVLQQVGAQETLLGLQTLQEVAGMPVVRLRTHTLPSHKSRLKRGMDLLLLVVLSPVLILLIAVTALYVRIVVGSPILHRQIRLGRDSVPFALLKFRTMGLDAEASGPVLASTNDQRVIPRAAWLRSTRFDELPQFWNVLRGDMSLVGPRPERPEFAHDIGISVPGYARRYELRPGITGLAQVQGRYHTAAVYKVGHDLQYLVNWSPVLDLQIILRTVWVIIARRV